MNACLGLLLPISFFSACWTSTHRGCSGEASSAETHSCAWTQRGLTRSEEAIIQEEIARSGSETACLRDVSRVIVEALGSRELQIVLIGEHHNVAAIARRVDRVLESVSQVGGVVVLLESDLLGARRGTRCDQADGRTLWSGCLHIQAGHRSAAGDAMVQMPELSITPIGLARYASGERAMMDALSGMYAARVAIYAEHSHVVFVVGIAHLKVLERSLQGHAGITVLMGGNEASYFRRW